MAQRIISFVSHNDFYSWKFMISEIHENANRLWKKKKWLDRKKNEMKFPEIRIFMNLSILVLKVHDKSNFSFMCG